MTSLRTRAPAVVIFVAIGIISVAIMGVSRQVTRGEEQRLLEQRASVEATELMNAFTAADSSLRSLGTLATLPGGETSFDAAATPLLIGNARTIALIRPRQATMQAQEVAGDALPSGTTLDSQRATLVQRALAAPDMVSVVLHDGYRRRLGLALAVPPDKGPLVVYEESTVDLTDPFELSTISAPADLNVAFYAGSAANPANLVESTGGGPSSSDYLTSVSVGADTWTLAVWPRHPLTGAFAQVAPWLLLGGGLVAAVLAAVAVDVVLRRRNFALALVDERTAELRESLAEVRRAHTELAATQDALVQSERLAALGQMASVVSHELRNPLGAVLNSLFVVRSALPPGTLSEATERSLSVAERETMKAANLAGELVDFARPRIPEPAQLTFGPLVREVLEVLPAPVGVRVVTGGADVPVYADHQHLVQLLSNLVANAYDAMPEGGSMRVEAAAAEEGGAARSAVITVSDTGQGIDKDKLEEIFEPFVTAKRQGTGLGLAIVRRIAVSNGGEVSVESTVGAGSCFTVRLPSRSGGPLHSAPAEGARL